MTDTTEAIREAHGQIMAALEHLGFADHAAVMPLHHAARNLSYALKAMSAPEVKADPLREALLHAVQGRIMNAKIDLQTGHTKAAAIKTLDGIIKFIDDEFAKPAPITTEQHLEAIAQIIEEKMADVWNDICSDTHCHPLDIEQIGRGPDLIFKPNHWSRQTAQTAATAILTLLPPVTTDRAAVIEAELIRLLKAVMRFVDRHAERKSGPGVIEVPLLPHEMKELRVSLEPFRALLNPK